MALTKPRLGQVYTNVAAITDAITVLHSGSSVANVDIGFVMNRANGSVSNVALYWSETLGGFVAAYTADAGGVDANVTPTTYANISSAYLKANAITSSNLNLSSGTVASPSLSLGSATNRGLYNPSTGGNIGIISSGYEQFRSTHISSYGTVNYVTASGGATGNVVVLGAEGTDNNVGILVKPRGAGNVSLGGNIWLSGMGTVTGVIRPTGGGGFTAIPTLTVSPPTTPGGYVAQISASMEQAAVTIAGGGTGYVAGDILTVVGGTASTTAQFQVTGISGGVITTINPVYTYGRYSVLPTNPVSVTGGSGTGATFNITSWAISPVFTISNSGAGYAEPATITYSGGGGGSGALMYPQIGTTQNFISLGSTIDLATPSGLGLRINDPVGTVSNYLQVQGATTSVAPRLVAQGGDPNIGITYGAKGTGGHIFYTNGVSDVQFRVASTSSAVNYVQVTGAATAATPSITAQGTDANVNLNIASKGNSQLYLSAGSSGGAVRLSANGSEQLIVQGAASVVNKINIKGGTTGNNATLWATGTDAAINLDLSSGTAGNISLYTNDVNGGTGVLQSLIQHTASANRYVVISGGVSGSSAPGIGTGGGQEAFDIFSNGNAIRFATNGSKAGLIQFSITPSNSTVNYLQVTGAATGVAPRIYPAGADTNIDTLLWAKGAGNVTTPNTFVISNTTSSTSNVTGALQVAGGVGVAGNVYVGNRVGYVYANAVSAAYTVYNSATLSVDTVFG